MKSLKPYQWESKPHVVLTIKYLYVYSTRRNVLKVVLVKKKFIKVYICITGTQA
jgi:hypothetical protein